VLNFFGSNRHSDGDLFSLSSLIFFEISVASTIMADDNRVVIIAVVIIISIDWKSSILSLY
jgi:hypothetical protein